MDVKRSCVLVKWDEFELKSQEIFIGNKIVRATHDEKTYYDVSLNKEVFLKRDGRIFSLTDFSNFHYLWFGQNDSKNGKPSTRKDIFLPYQEFKLNEEMERAKSYAVFLRNAHAYLGNNPSPTDIINFTLAYNKKLLPLVIKEIKKQMLSITDWWYTGGEQFDKDDIVEAVSVYEENLLPTLAAVSGTVYDYEKITKNPLFTLKK